ncbi:MAG: SpoIIE family protein phosphatase, partial [Calditrichia bacterium]
VMSVAEGGASDRAGMLPGDLILKINNKSFESANEADRLLRAGIAGKASQYEILRNNQTIILNVVLAKYGISLALLAILIGGFVYMGIGSFLLLKRPQIKAAVLLGLAFLSIGYFMAVILTQRSGGSTFFAIRALLVVITIYLGTAFWNNAGYYFPREITGITKKRWIERTNYALAVVFILLSILLQLFFKVSINIPIGIFIMIIFNIFISIKFRKYRTAEYKRLHRPIKWSSIFAGVATSLLVFYFLSEKLFNLFGFIGIPLMLIPLAYFHTIAHHGLLDISMKVRRNVQYVIVSFIWGFALIALFILLLTALAHLDLNLPNVKFSGLFIEVVDEPLSVQENQTATRILLMITVIALSIGFWKIGKRGQKWVDEKFFRSEYDYRRSASELAEVMATNLNIYDLSRAMVKKIGELMHLKQVGVLFFRDEIICCSQELHEHESEEWKNFCIQSQDEISRSIQQFQSEINVDYFPAHIRDNFRNSRFRFVIPIRSQQKLVGAILVGEKLSETTYHKEDLDFLSSVAKQASVAIENAFLYEELTDKERLKHELNIARQIQLASLPQKTPQIPGLDIAGLSIPAMEVGGDYFDYLNGNSHELTVIVGDVSGKGTSAALYMSKMQGILRSLSTFDLKPGELFIKANELLYRDIEKKSFITAIGATFHVTDGRVILARAGHLPLFHYKANGGDVERIIPKGIGLGLENSGIFARELEEITLHSKPGDVFLFATDGVTEAFGANGEEFGENKLMELLNLSAPENASTILQQSINTLRQFTGENSQFDDITMVVVKVV